jgi:hypothetical protein
MNSFVKKLSLFVLLILFIAPFTFTNCAKNPQSAEVPTTAFLSDDEKTEYFKNQFRGKVDSNFCERAQSYSCMKRVYSRNVSSEQLPPVKNCLSENFCVHTQVIHFNSHEAQDECAGCGDEYETENFVCHLKLANGDGIYPITKFSEILPEAIFQLQQLCQDLVDEP